MAKWDFDGDEALFFFVAAVVTIVASFRWYLPLARVKRFGQRSGVRALLGVTPPIAFLAVLLVLNRWSDPHSVQGHLDYILLFLAGEGLWLWATPVACSILGVSTRADAIERDNLAAGVTIVGAMLGATALYAYANVGAGPTIWTTIAPAFVATAVWLALWLVVELIGHPSEAIAVDRDLGTGIRHSLYLIASGLVLGRAVAGDWTSWASTFADFAQQGWPAVMLAICAAVVHQRFRPSPNDPAPCPNSRGVLPGGVFVLIALLVVAFEGKPQIGVHVITYEQYTGQAE